MDKQPTKEQIKEDIVLANQEINKWCGTEGINYYEGDTALGLSFKYAVPKLQEEGKFIQLEAFEQKGFRCIISNMITVRGGKMFYNDNPALALFWAIWEAVKEVKE